MLSKNRRKFNDDLAAYTYNQMKIINYKTKTMKIIYTVMVLLFAICLMGISAASYGQCQMQFEYNVEKGKKDGESKIYLTLKQSSPAFEFRLYDLYEDKVVQVKMLSSMRPGERTVVFQHVPASSYLIHVYKKGCDKPLTIGKLSGIVVDKISQ
jgi:hypothetical protein